MAKRSDRGLPPGSASVRPEDIAIFLLVMLKAENGAESERTNFQALFEDESDRRAGIATSARKTSWGITQPHSTTVGHLTRIVRHVFGPDSDLWMLFQRDGGGLRPTAEAKRLAKRLKDLKDLYDRLPEEVRPKSPRKTVRIGTPQTIGLHLISCVLSDWEGVFGVRGLDLNLEIANSNDLIRRLNSSLLDCVISYGFRSRDGNDEIIFESMGYSSRMVLPCHPHARLMARARQDSKTYSDLNSAYWEGPYKRGNRKDIPAFEDLRSITLEGVEFAHSRLFYIHSWDQPPAISDLITKFPPERVTRLNWYDDALAFVRMGQGIAIAPEAFARRRRVTAFRLSPENDFVRQIGAYYSREKPHGLDPDVCHVLEFIRQYMTKFELNIRQGRPPGLDAEYATFCKGFDHNQNWDQISKSKYSTKRK